MSHTHLQQLQAQVHSRALGFSTRSKACGYLNPTSRLGLSVTLTHLEPLQAQVQVVPVVLQQELTAIIIHIHRPISSLCVTRHNSTAQQQQGSSTSSRGAAPAAGVSASAGE